MKRLFLVLAAMMSLVCMAQRPTVKVFVNNTSGKDVEIRDEKDGMLVREWDDGVVAARISPKTEIVVEVSKYTGDWWRIEGWEYADPKSKHNRIEYAKGRKTIKGCYIRGEYLMGSLGYSDESFLSLENEEKKNVCTLKGHYQFRLIDLDTDGLFDYDYPMVKVRVHNYEGWIGNVWLCPYLTDMCEEPTYEKLFGEELK